MTPLSTLIAFFRSQLPRLNRHSLTGLWLHARHKSIIRTYLPPHPVIVEAGAHMGEDTADMARRYPDAVIHAFEPVPELYRTLTKRTTRYVNVIRHKTALSKRNGYAVLNVSSGTSNGSSSLLTPKAHLDIHPTVHFKKTIRVRTVTLDSWAKARRIPRIDLLWLDLQGMEYDVLRASRTIFPSVSLLYTEINLKENYTGTMLYPEFKKWLEEKGMEPVFENLYWKDMGNALFVRKAI